MSKGSMIRCSAPGSVMLLGEHAILRGGEALVAAIDRRITVSLVPREDDQIILHSERRGRYQTTWQALTVTEPYTFVLAAIKQARCEHLTGFELMIESDFSETLGLGSSAAVTVATLGVLQGLRASTKKGGGMPPQSLIKSGVAVIREVQGMGSGADIAASVLGGMVRYTSQSRQAFKLSKQPTIHLIYSGSKKRTPWVVERLQQTFEAGDLSHHLQQIAHYATRGCEAAAQGDWLGVAQQMLAQQRVMEVLQLTTPRIEMIIEALKQCPTVMAAKISGAGLGDCVVVLGELPPNYFSKTLSQADAGVQQLTVKITSRGVAW